MYTERLTITIPPEQLATGRAITRALDPDTGGAESWVPVYDTPPDPMTGVVGVVIAHVADTPCTPEFKAQAFAMLAAPELLFGAVAADYAARWPGLTPPTLAECQAFCSVAVYPDDQAPA